MGLFDKAKKKISENISAQIQQAQSAIADKLSDVAKDGPNRNSEIEKLRAQLDAAYNEINSLKNLLKEKESVIASYKRNENNTKPSATSQKPKGGKGVSERKNPAAPGSLKGRDVTPDFIESTAQEMCSELVDYGETVSKDVIATLDEINDKIERLYKEGISQIESVAEGLSEISENRAETLIAKVKKIESATMAQIRPLGEIDSILDQAFNKVEVRKQEILERLHAIAEIGEKYIEEIESQDLTASYDRCDISCECDSAERDIDSAYDEAVDTLNDLKNGCYIYTDDVNGKISDAENELSWAVDSAESDINLAVE